ncbi:MAG: dCMP deaminase family protein [Clostridia bacterium]
MVNKWDKRFMEMANLVSTWSSCFKTNRKVGAVIVKDRRVLTTGYNGAPAGVASCIERGYCIRERLNIESGTHQETCYAVHAEQNAIIQAAKLGLSVDGGTIYVTHQPCSLCSRMLINAGIKRIVYLKPYPDEFSLAILKEANVIVEQYKE